MDNEIMQEEETGHVALQRQARAYRSAGNFAAVETLLQEYRDLSAQGRLAPTAQIELEIQEYWTAEALAAHGTDEDADGATDALRKALTYFAPPHNYPHYSPLHQSNGLRRLTASSAPLLSSNSPRPAPPPTRHAKPFGWPNLGTWSVTKGTWPWHSNTSMKPWR